MQECRKACSEWIHSCWGYLENEQTRGMVIEKSVKVPGKEEVGV